MKRHLLIALALLLLAVLFSPWIMSALIKPADGSISTTNKIFLFVVSFALLVLALIFWRYGAEIASLKNIYRTLVLLLLCLVLVEAGLQLFTRFLPSPDQKRDLVAKMINLAVHKDKPWAQGYWQEFYSLVSLHEPYIGWRRQEFHGQYINIDSSGVRATWNTPASADVKKIFMLGGSTLWGSGARDDYTIPSDLAKILSQSKNKFEIINFGESGYTFLQEVIYLELQLRKGAKPDYVFFYDGVNDTYNAYQQGTPEQVQNTLLLREKLSGKELTPIQQIVGGFSALLKKHSMIYRVVDNLAHIAAVRKNPQDQFQEIGSSMTTDQLASLAQKTVADYLSSLRLLNNLSKIYGFKYALYWQPSAFTKNSLTDDERRSDPRISDQKLAFLFMQIRAGLDAQAGFNFYDLSGVLTDKPETYFIDFAHVTENANQLIAQKISEIIKVKFGYQFNQ